MKKERKLGLVAGLMFIVATAAGVGELAFFTAAWRSKCG